MTTNAAKTGLVLSKIIILFFILVSLPLTAQQISYTNGNDSWNPDLLGNHRAVLNYTGKGSIAKATIEWRRRDENPELKRIIVQDSNGKGIINVKTTNINRETGTVFFEPISGKGTYYVYYLPYIDEGLNVYYPKGVYAKPENTADAKWLNKIKNISATNCSVVEIQGINAFNSFYPMEVIATAAETKKIISKNSGNPFLVFPEDRLHSIRMRNDLPQRWIEKGVQNTFSDTALKGEYLAFQLGIYALKDLKDVKVTFSDLKNGNGAIITAKNISCINTDGVKYDRSVFTNSVNVSKGQVQAMWCGIDVPKNTLAGVYNGFALVSNSGGVSQKIAIHLKVSDIVTLNGGIDQPDKMTRLKWLNSTMAQENKVIAPYTPLEVNGTSISLLGRKVFLNVTGLPDQIQTFFTPEMTSIGTKANDILSAPAQFHLLDIDGKEINNWKNTNFKFTKVEAGTVSWESNITNAAVDIQINGSLEFDGFLSYTVKITALEDVAFSDINFNLPMQPTSAKYLMGLGKIGGASRKFKMEVGCCQ